MTVLTPEFLSTKTYSAIRDRLMFQHGGMIQAGVWGAGDYKVSQKASGANMSVDVASGFAIVNANDPNNAGLYHVQNDATVNVPQPTASHGTLPRLDKLVLLINDTTDGGDAVDNGVLQWVTGTATSGTTLDNGNDGAHGAGTLPTGSLLLADVLVPAGSGTMTVANIRDRRPWARGAYFYAFSGGGGTPVTTASGTETSLSSKLGAQRIELSGVPVFIQAAGLLSNSAAGGNSWLRVYMNSINVADVSNAPGAGITWAAVNLVDTTLPAGSYLADLRIFGNSGGTISIADIPQNRIVLRLREDVSARNSNN